MKSNEIKKTIDLILKAIALAMGVAVTVLSILGSLEAESAVGMLGIGLACLAITQFAKSKETLMEDQDP